MSSSLVLCIQGSSEDSPLQDTLRSMFSEFPIRFSDVRVQKGEIMLVFENSEQGFSYGLKLIEENNWEQPFRVSNSQLTISSIDKYRWRNIIRLGASGSSLCSEEVKRSLQLSLTSCIEILDVRVGICTVRQELFVFLTNSRDKNLCTDQIIRRKFVFAGQTLKTLQTIRRKIRRRKRVWDDRKAEEKQTKYLKFAENKSNLLMRLVDEAVEELDPLADEEIVQGSQNKLFHLQMRLKSELRNRNLIRDGDERTLSGYAHDLREKIRDSLHSKKGELDHTLADVQNVESKFGEESPRDAKLGEKAKYWGPKSYSTT